MAKNRIIKYLIVVILLFSPLLLGSVHPIWQWFWIVYIALVGTYVFITAARGNIGGAGHSQLCNLPIFPTISVVIVIVLGLVQASSAVAPEDLLYLATINNSSSTYQVMSFERESSLKVALSFLSHFVLFAIIYTYCERQSSVRFVFTTVAVISLIYATYGIVSHFGLGDIVLSHQNLGGQGSLSSTFVNRNNYATYAGLGFIASLACLTNNAIRQPRGGGNLQNQVQSIIGTFSGFGWIVIIAGFVLISTVFLSGSKAGVLSTFLGVIFAVMMQTSREVGKSKALALIALALLFCAILFLSGELLLARSMRSDIGQDRFAIYSSLVDTILIYPLWGTGAGTFEQIFPIVRSPNILPFFVRAHSEYLELALTFGIPVSILFIVGMLHVLKNLYKGHKESNYNSPFVAFGIGAVVLILSHSFVDFPMQIPAVSYTFVALLSSSLAHARRL